MSCLTNPLQDAWYTFTEEINIEIMPSFNQRLHPVLRSSHASPAQKSSLYMCLPSSDVFQRYESWSPHLQMFPEKVWMKSASHWSHVLRSQLSVVFDL